MNRTQFWLAGGVVLLAVAFVGWKSSRPPRVEALVVRLENVTSTLAVSGVLEATDRSSISSQLSVGLVKSVRVDIGDLINVGDVLVVLDDVDLKAQLSGADALIKQSEAQSHLQDVIAGSASSSVTLAQQGLASVNELRSAVTSARVGRDSAAAKFQQAGVNLRRVANSSRIEQIRMAKAQLNRALAVTDLARLQANRRAALYREGAISQEENDVAQTTLATAEQDLEVAREQVRLASTPRPEDLQTAESVVLETKLALKGASDLLALAHRGLNERLASRQQLVQAKGQLESAIASKQVGEATKLSGQAQRESALSALSKTILRSPIRGRVSQRKVEPGQTVGSGVPLIMIEGTNQLRVHLNVEESSIALVKVGAKATVGIDAFPGLQIAAVVSEIGSAANFQLGTLEVRLALLEGDSRLKPELTADANIIVSEFKQVVVVPRAALIVSGKEASVYVVQKGIVTSRPIRWSKGNQSNVVINSGIEPGEIVLLNPLGSKLGSHVDVIYASTGKGK